MVRAEWVWHACEINKRSSFPTDFRLESVKIRLMKNTLALLVLTISLTACQMLAEARYTPAETAIAEQDAVPVTGQAVVEELELTMLESFPVQVLAQVRGSLPDSCTTIEEIRVTRTQETFQLELITTRSQAEMCAQALQPFDEQIALDVVNLAAGSYAVRAGDKEASFNLDVDNVQAIPSGG